MLVGCGPKLFTADCVDVNIWSIFCRENEKYLPLTYMRVIYIRVLSILGAHTPCETFDYKYNYKKIIHPQFLRKYLRIVVEIREKKNF